MILSQFLNILFPYKVCATEKKTYVNKGLSFNSFVVDTL